MKFYIEICSVLNLCMQLIECLFGGFRPTENFFNQIETLTLPVKVCKFAKLCLALTAIDQ